MTALEGNSVDFPDIALIAERIDVCVLDLAMLTGAVDGLRLRLTGIGLSFIQMMSLRRYQPVSRRANASIHGMPIMSFGLQPSTLLLRATA